MDVLSFIHPTVPPVPIVGRISASASANMGQAIKSRIRAHPPNYQSLIVGRISGAHPAIWARPSEVALRHHDHIIGLDRLIHFNPFQQFFLTPDGAYNLNPAGGRLIIHSAGHGQRLDDGQAFLVII